MGLTKTLEVKYKRNSYFYIFNDLIWLLIFWEIFFYSWIQWGFGLLYFLSRGIMEIVKQAAYRISAFNCLSPLWRKASSPLTLWVHLSTDWEIVSDRVWRVGVWQGLSLLRRVENPFRVGSLTNGHQENIACPFRIVGVARLWMLNILPACSHAYRLPFGQVCSSRLATCVGRIKSPVASLQDYLRSVTFHLYNFIRMSFFLILS